jgi:hypothetical protein
MHKQHPVRPDSVSVLVVANRTCPCPALPAAVLAQIDGRGGSVLVLAPALNTRIRHWVSDIDSAVREAELRMVSIIAELRNHGLTVQGEVGDADPLVAIEDALIGFKADQIIISTWPAGRSNWLEKDLLRRAEERFTLPVTHVSSPYDAPVALAAA